jgi:hypothetical protein
MAESADPENAAQKWNDERSVSGEPAAAKKEISRWAAAALLAAVILLFAAIRWRVREMPLERDEGEYAYAGQLILQGIPPYELAYNMKLPGTYAAYAAMLRVFGETAAGIHLGMLVVNGCTTLLLYFVGRRLYGRTGGVTAAASYGLLSTSEALLGLSGHATHFVVLLAVPGILLLLAARESKDAKIYFAAGLCMGLAFVMKQPGAVFIIFGGQEIAWNGWKEPEERKRLGARLLAYGVGVAIPYLVTCAVLWRAGVFGRFWFWTVSYASQYATTTGVAEGSLYLWKALPQLFFAAPVVWCFAAAGLLILCIQQKLRAALSLEFSLLVWSFLGASAGLYYRPHYFILLLPVASLLAGKGVAWLTEQTPRHSYGNTLRVAGAAGFVVAYGIAIYAQREGFFELSPASVIRAKYGGNPFPEAIEFGKYIREHSEADARVAVLGSEPEIYFYAKRHSATGYIYTYPLMEEQKFASKMQQEMIEEIEKTRPEYLVKVLVPTSWLRQRNSDAAILEWGEKYIGENYRVVGAAEIGLETNYRWDQDAVGFTSHSKYSMYLYKRKL